jgi:hypothetical protein
MAKAKSVLRKAAVVAGAMAGAGVMVLGSGGVASAATAGVDVWSASCHGTMYSRYTSTGWEVYNQVDNRAGEVPCSGWMDWTPDGNTSNYYGLRNRIGVGEGVTYPTAYLSDNSPALTRVCVQAANDGKARCSAWW